ncbi:quinone oxidoreductase family protein [Conexibacter woesei]|uniref:quinone oxidoreductase family protein n=1 Tax=Conexibacter woesei TaxID=191495 RepID=UPI0004055D6F|nr:zinc-binding alcohol dehydrogenase family protein [Conexibacter woesei]
MHAAVVTSFSAPPQYASFEDPVVSGPDELVVDVLAAGLHQRVRSAADGTHYESDGQLPLIPGFDGVGRDADGALRYFILPDTRLGSMAERVAIDARRSVVLPDDVDPVVLAAAMNPAMSAWLALRRRIDFTPGSNVMVLGATGNAGRMAVQIARHLGAASVVGAARPSARLDALLALGADRVVALDDVGPAAGDVDVVLDYLWGTATAAALPAVLTARPDRGRPLTWIQIGSMAGLDLTVPSAWLRAARLALVGSGQGSVPTRDIVAELPALAAHLTTNAYTIDATPTPLAEVATAWTAPRSTNRIVFTP